MSITDEWIKKALENEKVTMALENSLPITTVKPDDDIIGATIGQAWLLVRGIPNFTPRVTDTFTFIVNPVAMKLNALRYHRKKYEEIQKIKIEEINSNRALALGIQKGIKFCELDMLYEVEAFFFQYKSALDMLVKILCPIAGQSAGSFSTYGDSGAKVIKALNNLKRNNKLNLTIGRVDWLIEEIEKAKSPWLESVIKLRNDFSHYKTDIHFGFEWDEVAGRVRVPSSETNEGYQAFNLVMDELTESLILYCANFIALAMSCAIPLEIGIQVMSDNEKKYIGARWNMDLSKAIWKLASNVIREYSEEDIAKARQLAKQEGL
jgi:hypothetical protein